MTDSENAKIPTRSGFVALIGAPNAGKSTLVNQLVGTKVSIVTHKVQTTRAIIRGIATVGNTQIVLVDTPGIFAPRRALDRAMVSTAWSGARDADIIVLLMDAERGINDDGVKILQALEKLSGHRLLVLNKIDRVRPEKLLELTRQASDIVPFDKVFMLSALTGSGCPDLAEYLAEKLPEGPWYYPSDEVSDLPMRQLAAEITREKLFLRLHQELPYSSHVETESWQENRNGSVHIRQVIYVQRDTQKKILLGQHGATIKAIGQAARKELEEVLDQRVHLFLFVKVRQNWGQDPERFRAMGLEFPG